MENLDKLKTKAKQLIKERSLIDESQYDFNQLLQEIEIYQAELKAQNEELIENELLISDALKFNQVLFDEAPLPYIYTNKDFYIQNANKIAYSTFKIPITNKFNIFYKFIAKGSLGRFITWIQSNEYINKPIEIDLHTYDKIKRFRVFANKTSDENNFFLISLLDIHEEYLLSKKSEKTNELLFEVAQNQTDMLIVLNKNYDFKFANKSFLSFFNVKSSKEFLSTYGSIKNTFIKKDNFFYPKKEDQKAWIKKLIQLDDSKRSVCINDPQNKKPKVFMINVAVTMLEDYIFTFSEITHFSKETEDLREKSYVDELTQIYNRAKFNEFLKYEFDYFNRKHSDLSLIMFDIDFFKDINDTHGHDIGDKILVELCQLLSQYIRKMDVFTRWGGEEFAILLKSCNLEQSSSLAEKLRKIIEEHTFYNNIKLTCSFGISQARKSDSIDSFTKRVDVNLYKAKNNGRNTIQY